VRAKRIWVMVTRFALYILFFFFLHLIAFLVIPGLSSRIKEGSMPQGLIGYLDPVLQGRHGEGQGVTLREDSLLQSIRDEEVFKRLLEMKLGEESKPPLPRVSLFPSGKVDEEEQRKILEDSRFYQELEDIIQGEWWENAFADVPRPKTGDVKGGTVPLPKDVTAQNIIADLKEAAQEEATGNQSVEAKTLAITGPAADRKVNYMPPPLQSKPSVDDSSLFKFWVLPDGTVSKVIPMDKGDTHALLACVDHIKKYRFNPLPRTVPQVEMWGVIPVQSVLQ
jgi:hypothetical protein